MWQFQDRTNAPIDTSRWANVFGEHVLSRMVRLMVCSGSDPAGLVLKLSISHTCASLCVIFPLLTHTFPHWPNMTLQACGLSQVLSAFFVRLRLKILSERWFLESQKAVRVMFGGATICFGSSSSSLPTFTACSCHTDVVLGAVLLSSCSSSKPKLVV